MQQGNQAFRAVLRRIWLTASLALLTAFSAPALADPVDFTLIGTDKTAVKLSDYRGKWVIVNFWATWCPPCVEELPMLAAFHEQHRKQGVTVLGVNVEDINQAALQDFIENMKLSFPIGQSGKQPLTPFEPLLGLPTTFIVSPGGELVTRFTGSITRQWLDKAMQTLDVF